MVHRNAGTIKKWMRILGVAERKEGKPRPIINEQNKKLVRQAIEDGTFSEKLTPLQQFYLLARYMEPKPKTQQELADLTQHGGSKAERRVISQVERKALEKLRAKAKRASKQV